MTPGNGETTIAIGKRSRGPRRLCASISPFTEKDHQILMLTEPERELVFRHAYIPEHLPDYVHAISCAEPHLYEGYLCYSLGTIFIFIGYPLRAEPGEPFEEDVNAVLESACKRFRPKTVSVIAPRLRADDSVTIHDGDHYFRVDLPLATGGPEAAYMLRRAGRDLGVAEGIFGKEHEALIETFIAERNFDAAHQEIFRGIPRYLSTSRTARLLEARKGQTLVAFTIADLGSAEYGFYLFNFRSRAIHVPGASDLLFHKMAEIAQAAGKRRLNLGLGVNPGIRRFKEKWGATPFLPYVWGTIERKRRGLLRALLGR